MSGPLDPYEELVADVVDALPAWLVTQRWFAGKDRNISAVHPLGWTALLEGDPLLLHLVIEVEQDDRREPYQLLVGRREAEAPDVPAAAMIGASRCYEASGDADLTAALLDHIASGSTVGDLRFELEPGAEMSSGLRAHPITSEQSNTSLVYGSQYILKLFRKLTPGLNKDLRLHRALREVGCEHIADPLGAITGVLDDEPTTIGMLQRFMPDAADGWVMATTSVRDYMADDLLPPEELGGDFGGEAERLGRAVATVHADLARALGIETSDAADIEQTVDVMVARLGRIAADVPQLEPHAEAIREAFERLRGRTDMLPMQYVHGDLHLGQVLRTLSGWLLLDFEGEPAATLAERTALRSPLRDVAGMLRSFDYAAQQLLIGQPDDPFRTDRAMAWARHNRSAFCDGYAAVAGHDPRADAEVLLAFELDKAVYEVSYEHANRPDWLTVPLSSIDRIMTEGS